MITLSHQDFMARLASGALQFPEVLLPYCGIDPVKFRGFETLHSNQKHSFANALDQIRMRVDRDQFGKIYALQSRTLHHAARAFPAYRFLIPEVIANDWLASVDWRKYHRDHIVHQPQVSYVLLSLLDRLIINGRPLIEHCLDHVLSLVRSGYLRQALLGMGIANNDLFMATRPATRNLWRFVFRETAFLASLFHDIGYPWQYANRFAVKLPVAHDGQHLVTPDAAKVLNAFDGRLVLLPFEGYRINIGARPAQWHQDKLALIEKCLAESHGLPGALFFLYLHDRTRPYPSETLHPVRRLCAEWASVGILMHDLQRAYWDDHNGPVLNPHLRLTLPIDPLSCVLTLADTVQDFERHLARFSPTADGVLRVDYPIPCAATEVDFDDASQTLRINYIMNTSTDTILKRSHLPKEEKLIFDPDKGFVDLSACGVQRVRMTASTVP